MMSTHLPRLIPVLMTCLAMNSAITAAAEAQQPERPNILWITCEDISPNLGCYGDEYAVTPNIDRLASQGVLYTKAFAPIGVCAPARSCLITGMYPPSIGTQHMRCQGTLPEYIRCFTEYLREAGYYCSNNSKTDYNFQHNKSAWDESSRRAHWRKRKPGQPFFSVLNFTSCHESQIRLSEQAYVNRTADFTDDQRHNPAQAPVPPYHPDTPEVRKDWARYADMITYMDQQVGEVLAELEADGLADNTIVFYFSDHGAGMPRSKRWLYDSSMHVPLIIRFPKSCEQWAPDKPGLKTDRLVSFVDFGPTVLSLADVQIPEHMQGQPFLGAQAAEPRRYVYGYRDRMDERYDLIRAVRDQRYKYLRNYMPHLPWFQHQHISYMYQMPTMQVWQKLADAGKLQGAEAIFMAMSKPVEELYDTQTDPHEIHNLAASPDHQGILRRLRKAHREWMEEIVDLGLLPEADLRTRFGSQPPYDAVRQQPDLYPQRRIAAAADLANRRDPSAMPQLISRLDDTDPAIRYWAVVGIGALNQPNESAIERLQGILTDSSAAVRVAAADALCRLQRHEAAIPVLMESMEDDNPWIRLQAANVLDRIDEHARPALASLQKALKDENGYVVRVAEHALKQWDSLQGSGDPNP